jgi:hypothetical protein
MSSYLFKVIIAAFLEGMCCGTCSIPRESFAEAGGGTLESKIQLC